MMPQGLTGQKRTTARGVKTRKNSDLEKISPSYNPHSPKIKCVASLED